MCHSRQSANFAELGGYCRDAAYSLHQSFLIFIYQWSMSANISEQSSPGRRQSLTIFEPYIESSLQWTLCLLILKLPQRPVFQTSHFRNSLLSCRHGSLSVYHATSMCLFMSQQKAKWQKEIQMQVIMTVSRQGQISPPPIAACRCPI